MGNLFASLGRVLWFVVKLLIAVTVIRFTAYQIGYRDHIPVLDNMLFALLRQVQALAYWMAGVLESIALFARYIRR